MNVRRIHYFTGIGLCLFIGMHLFNHVWGIRGIEAHISMMENLRLFYRNILVEVLLLGAAFMQAISGILLARKLRGTPKTRWDKLHIWSGYYLAYFLVFHSGAVLVGRNFLHLDTNYYFGVAGINSFPTCLFFIPYYILAVMSVTGHIAAIHRKKMERNILGLTPHRQSVVILLLGVVLTFFVFWGLTQGFQGVTVPQPYEILQGK